jgi:RNA-directed DNA polymerase
VRERLNAKLKQVKATLRRMMHLALPEQGRYLRLVVNGFYNCYAVPTNFRALNAFYWHIMRSWQHCLRRRSQRHRLACQRMMRLTERWLPTRSCGTPVPLAVRRGPEGELGALAAHAGICAGGGEQSPSLPNRPFQWLRTTQIAMDVAWRILCPYERRPSPAKACGPAHSL